MKSHSGDISSGVILDAAPESLAQCKARVSDFPLQSDDRKRQRSGVVSRASCDRALGISRVG